MLHDKTAGVRSRQHQLPTNYNLACDEMQQQISAFVLSEAGLEPAEPSAVNSNTERAPWAEREPVTHTAATFRTRSIVDRFYSQTLLQIEVQQVVCRARYCLRSMSHGKAARVAALLGSCSPEAHIHRKRIILTARRAHISNRTRTILRQACVQESAAYLGVRHGLYDCCARDCLDRSLCAIVEGRSCLGLNVLELSQVVAMNTCV